MHPMTDEHGDSIQADLAALFARRKLLRYLTLLVMLLVILLSLLAASGVAIAGFLALALFVPVVFEPKVARDLKRIDEAAHTASRPVTLTIRQSAHAFGGSRLRQYYVEVSEQGQPIVKVPVGSPLSGIPAKQRVAQITSPISGEARGDLQAGGWVVLIVNKQIIPPSAPCRAV